MIPRIYSLGGYMRAQDLRRPAVHRLRPGVWVFVGTVSRRGRRAYPTWREAYDAALESVAGS